MRKIMLFVLFALASVLITQYQIQYIKKETLQSFEPVYVFSKTLDKGTVITSSDLELGKINAQWQSEDYVLNQIDIIGKAVTEDVGKNTIVTQQVLTTETSPTQLTGENTGMTAIKFAPETAMCWRLEAGDWVTLYWADSEVGVLTLGNVLVKAVYNDDMTEKNSRDVAEYLLIEAPIEVIEKVIAERERGHYEIIRTGDNISGTLD